MLIRVVIVVIVTSIFMIYGSGLLTILSFIGGAMWIAAFDKKQKREELSRREDKLHQVRTQLLYNDLHISQEYTGKDKNSSIILDENKKVVYLIKGETKRKFTYQDILQSEILEDGIQSTSTSRTSQIGSALVGGLIAGVPGLIIGGLSGKQNTINKVKKIDLRIIVNDTNEPIFHLNFLEVEDTFVKKDHPSYQAAIKDANHWHNLISVLIRKADEEDRRNDKNNQQNFQTETNSIDQLVKLSSLLKEGMITEDEYNKQKKKLLG
ncbi:hypothetical protein BRE01_34730 [Brevibacillus reuszeri]|uniref:SHOCT domain-containing protein n=1 Tax=Brevibacillus reuszeri TaxID=54915 RepID=A0ABQ0TPK4_9BACL|nr:SHOCT domain-containing protein [Brevibacillus reuszeri]MED1861232.1 SHOCT domain-containing protein [Brevibacillus reuszeri]GED69771.1 hypothetical protein BRE01_34730 [Brevibacillus reuszeri]